VDVITRPCQAGTTATRDPAGASWSTLGAVGAGARLTTPPAQAWVNPSGIIEAAWVEYQGGWTSKEVMLRRYNR
jgi:hypothetical protein